MGRFIERRRPNIWRNTKACNSHFRTNDERFHTQVLLHRKNSRGGSRWSVKLVLWRMGDLHSGSRRCHTWDVCWLSRNRRKMLLGRWHSKFCYRFRQGHILYWQYLNEWVIYQSNLGRQHCKRHTVRFRSANIRTREPHIRRLHANSRHHTVWDWFLF